VLAAQVAVSVGWFGLVAAMLVLSINAATAQAVGASGAAYALIDDVSGTLIAPSPASFSIASLLTGVVLALGTRWGLFEHYWIQTKPLLTVVVILSGTFLVDRWIQQASAIPEGSPPMLLIYASVVHLLMLGAATLISAYEPWGATRRGRRDAKQRRVKRSVNGKARIVPGTRASDGADATEAQEGFDRVNKTPHQRTEAREGNPIDEHSSERSAVGGGLVLLRGGRLIGPLFGLLFLAYPLGALLTFDPSSARLALALCGTALFVGVFLWLLWSREPFRAATAEAPEVRKRRSAVAVLAVLALLLTLVGGDEWLALFVHAGVAAGLVLPGKDAPAAVVGLAVLAVVPGSSQGRSGPPSGGSRCRWSPCAS
jgi:hypothetical protein